MSALLVNEVAAWFFCGAQVFEAVGHHRRHPSLLNLRIGSMDEVGLLDAGFEFEPDSDSTGAGVF